GVGGGGGGEGWGGVPPVAPRPGGGSPRPGGGGGEGVGRACLRAFRDPRHERATAEAVARAMPDVYVSPSCDVFPQIKEFERVSTTVVNAYVGPALSRYLYRLADRLKEAGYTGPVLIMQSHGGVAPIAEAARLA